MGDGVQDEMQELFFVMETWSLFVVLGLVQHMCFWPWSPQKRSLG